MKRVLFLLLFIVLNISLWAQTDSLAGGNVTYEIIEKRAEYIGGQAELFKYLQKNLKLPNNPLKLDAKIRVVVKFIIEKDGSVQDVKIIDEDETRNNALEEIKKRNSSFFKPYNEIKKEAAEKLVSDFFDSAKAVVASMQAWKPGMQRDNPVRSYFSLPINYKFGFF